MPRSSLLLLALLAAAGPVRADDAPHTPVAVAIFHPLSTNQAPVHTNLDLSLLYGDVGAVHGISLHGLTSRVRGDVYGAHGALAWSRIDGNFGGELLVPGVSWVKGDATGAQIALFALVNGGYTRGVYLAGALNVVDGDFVGIQAAGAADVVDRNATGVVTSAFGNIVGGDFRGLAFATGYNYAGGRSMGLQIGGVNFAQRAMGVQFGIANFAHDAHGLQIGIVNAADGQWGVPIGMINLAGNGLVEGVAYTSSASAIAVGVRTEVHHVSSMVTLGGIDREGDIKETAILTWNLGFGIPVTGGTELILDGGLAHYIPKQSDDPADNDRLHFATQLRAIVRAHLGPRVRLIAGGGINRVFPEYADNVAGETKPLWLAGVAWQ